MSKRISVATEGSANAHQAVVATVELASRAGGDVRDVRECGFFGRPGEDESGEGAEAHKVLDEGLGERGASRIKARSALPGARVRHVPREILHGADRLDEGLGEGSSVLLTGKGHCPTDPAGLEVVGSLGVAPWAGGEQRGFVRITARAVTGRRIRSR